MWYLYKLKDITRVHCKNSYPQKKDKKIQLRKFGVFRSPLK